MQAMFDELKRYVGFGAADEAALPPLGALLAPEFPRVAQAFYARILEHPDARQVLVRGERGVGHLKPTLVQWLGELFAGPWDGAYLERRARIGRVHVRIALPQHYMVTAMNVVRHELFSSLRASLDPQSEAGRAAQVALGRILDIDLALMLHTFREDMEARRATAERLATYGQLVGSIGHELRNPLGVIETSLYVLRTKREPDPATDKHLDRIAQQVTLANDIITQLLDLIRDQPMQRQPVPLGPLVTEAISTVPLPPGVKLEVLGASDGLVAQGDATQLHQVVVNLLTNALEAVMAKGAVRVSLARDGKLLRLDVDDSGPGIDVSVMARLFEPLVTTRLKGIGLGLALVKRIVDRHGGAIEAGRGPLGGARFTVRLPQAPP